MALRAVELIEAVSALQAREQRHNDDAERAVLGSVIIDNDALHRVAGLVEVEDFFRKAHRAIFGTMRTMVTQRRPLDFITLKDELSKTGQLEMVGGSPYISGLTDGIPDIANVEAYARIVSECSAARKATAVYSRAAIAADEGRPLEEIAAQILPDLPDSRSLKNTGTGMSAVRAWEKPEPEPMKYIIEGMVPYGHITTMFGDGGSGKSYTSIYIAECLALGLPVFGRESMRTPSVVLDFETEEPVFLGHGYRVARGLGLDRIPEGVYYVQCAVPLTDDATFAAVTEIARDKFVILDSVAPASCASDQVDPSEIVPFMQRLRQLGVAVLLLDHVAKPIAGQSAPPLRAYGSTFKHNLVRSSLRLERGAAGGMRLTQMKHNFGRLAEPITFVMTHGFDAVKFEQIRSDDERLAGIAERSLPAPERIVAELAQFGPDGTTAERIATLIGCSKKTISNHLSQLRQQRRVEPCDFGKWRSVPEGVRKVPGNGGRT